MKKWISFVAALLLGLSFGHAQDPETRLLRFPAVSGNKVVFSYGGDLYTVARTGGLARKITTHPGYEMFPRFSRNGQTIAFTGQYDGNTEVFTIPAEGGEPTRLTITATLGRDEVSDRMGPNNVVMTWTPDDKSVVFRSRMNSFNGFKGSLFSVSAQGGLAQQLPFAYAGWCSYSPDGKKIAFNKVFREFRTWKYYQGGMADDLWVFDTEKKTVEKIVEHVAQDIMPMWHGNRVYFISDRDRTMNLFYVDLTTKQITKVTDFKEYDIKFPSIGGDDIIFENGGYLYIYNIPSGKQEKLTITIKDDQSQGRDKFMDVSQNIEAVSIGPDGNRVAVCARGDLFTVPKKEGFTRHLTHSSNAHDRSPAWSPDGKWIAYISDTSGEDEIYLLAQDGTGEPVQLTKNADTYKFGVSWSPDSKHLIWTDQKKRLNYLNIDEKKIITIATSEQDEIYEVSWSPDSKYIAYAMEQTQTKKQIYLYSISDKKTQAVTDNWYESGNPSFSPDGKFLFFYSMRDFNPIYSQTEWNTAYTDMAKPYFVILSASTPSPLAPGNDEVTQGENKSAATPPANGTPAEVKVTVDWYGISDRILSLPVEASSYFNLIASTDKVYYMRRNFKESKSSMWVYDFKKKKETKIGDFDRFQLSADRKKMLIASERSYYVVDAPDDKIELKDKVDMSGLKMWVDRNAEWTEIFNECWRQMRDFFYDPNMHGVNWDKIKEKYAPLVPFVRNRADLTYIIGEMIGELNAGHAYVGDGDLNRPDRIALGLLGAVLEKDNSGYVRVAKVLDGENWSKELPSPLTEPGVNVNPGEFIIAVNGRPVNEVTNFHQLMVGTANRVTELTVNSKPSPDGARKVLVTPIEDESSLYYFNWVRENIRKVSEATNGRVGYLHVPDMGPKGLNEFMKHFYPQLNKEALIIDVRGNGGGNVSPMLIERLRRELDMVNMARNTAPSSNPFEMVVGPKVAILDQYTVSDGDLFSYRFRKNNLGKLVGQRSWGGVVGIRGTLPLMDGGTLQRPEYGKYGADGKEWIIEGTGIYPDIEVVNDPYQEYMGNDQQLNKSIEVILEELKSKGQKLPPPPPYPNKSK